MTMTGLPLAVVFFLFFFPCNEDGDNNRRKQVDVLLNDMEEKELIVMEATAQGLKKARETAE